MNELTALPDSGRSPLNILTASVLSKQTSKKYNAPLQGRCIDLLVRHSTFRTVHVVSMQAVGISCLVPPYIAFRRSF